MSDNGHGARNVRQWPWCGFFSLQQFDLGLLETRQLDKANELLDELKQRCLVHDGAANATFKECYFNKAMESGKSLLDKQFKMVPTTCNVLLEVLLKLGRKTEAWALFDQRLGNHTLPSFQAVNSGTFSIMVNDCVQLGKIEETIVAFNKVRTKANSKSFAVDVAEYNNVIARCCENAMLSKAVC